METRSPAAAKLLSQVKIDPAVVNGWILAIGSDGEDPADIAEAWIEANVDTVNGWIN